MARPGPTWHVGLQVPRTPRRFSELHVCRIGHELKVALTSKSVPHACSRSSEAKRFAGMRAGETELDRRREVAHPMVKQTDGGSDGQRRFKTLWRGNRGMSPVGV